MALSANTVWEVRTDGDNTNGGGFVAGASGTDFSQQASAQVTYTDLAIDSSDSTKLTSSANPFTSAHVGNILNVTGGTGFTTGRYEVVSVTGNTATMDRSVGTAGSTGGSGKLGGAFATLGAAISGASAPIVAGNTVWVRGGTYSVSSSINPTTAGTQSAPIRVRGYGTTRGDGGRPTLQAATGGMDVLLSRNTSFFQYWDIIVDGAGLGSRLFLCDGPRTVLIRCLAKDRRAVTASQGFVVATGLLIDCEATGGQGVAFRLSSRSLAFACYAHDSSNGAGFHLTGTSSAIRCIADTLSGSTSDGFLLDDTQAGAVISCIAYNCGGDGIRFSAGMFPNSVRNCILSNNGGYGIRLNAAEAGSGLLADYNAYFDNALGARLNVEAGPNDVILTSSPFVDAAGANFALNDTPGGGAACRGAGDPGTLPGLSTTGYESIGVFQEQSTAAGGGPGPRLSFVVPRSRRVLRGI